MSAIRLLCVFVCFYCIFLHFFSLFIVLCVYPVYDFYIILYYYYTTIMLHYFNSIVFVTRTRLILKVYSFFDLLSILCGLCSVMFSMCYIC